MVATLPLEGVETYMLLLARTATQGGKWDAPTLGLLLFHDAGALALLVSTAYSLEAIAIVF